MILFSCSDFVGGAEDNCELVQYDNNLKVKRVKITQIKVVVKDIYQGEDNHWLHDFANEYKIKTKQKVIISRLPFQLGDKVSNAEIREAERILRNLAYLRDAMISLSTDGVLSVVVFDNWTLFPNISFGRKGGQSKYSVGIRDSNILGLGIAATLAYKTDAQKKGYRLRTTTPVGWFEQDLLNLVLEDYDTGKASQFSYEKPFYSFDSDSMFNFSAGNQDIAETLYQNGEALAVYDTSQTYFKHQVGWLSSKNSNLITRNKVGVVSDKVNLNSASLNLYGGLEKDREQWFVWWGQERIENKFRVEKNIFYITSKEDINFGTEYNYMFGVGKSQYDQLVEEDMFVLAGEFTKTFTHNKWLNFNKVKLYSEVTKSQDYLTFNYDFELFYPMTDAYVMYFASHYSYINQYRLKPNAVGDDSYLRGYPLQYQHGRQTWTKNLELRRYSDTIIFKSFALGWSLFIDAGKAWDNFDDNQQNIETNSLYSIGLGARFYSLISSGKEVVHIDIVKPFSENKEIDGWEWRISSKKTF